MKTTMKVRLKAFYLDWVNNFITVDKLAEHYEIEVQHAKQLIKIGKYYHEKAVSELKLSRENLLHEFLKRNTGWQTIAHIERKTAERLEEKGVIELARHKNATWQARLKEG